MVIDPRFCQLIQFVQLLLSIALRGELHLQPSDKVVFDQIKRKFGILAVDALHGLVDGQPFAVVSDELAIAGIDIHVLQGLPGEIPDFIG